LVFQQNTTVTAYNTRQAPTVPTVAEEEGTSRYVVAITSVPAKQMKAVMSLLWYHKSKRWE